MCRKSQLQGWCLVCLGLGILLGYWIDRWILCTLGSLGLLTLGFCRMKRLS